MKIVSLGVENIKRVVALEIEPDGNLVQITGKNGNGKTSVLDAIWWALAGKRPIQRKPIRDGADEARIVLVLGDPKSDDPKKRRELTITRTFKRIEDGDYTTSLRVKNSEGWTPQGGGQELLDGMINALSFDPLAFANMDAAKQFETLKQFVPGFDFAANAGQRDATHERRHDVNKLAKQSRAAASLIVVPDGTPDEPVDDAALVDELQRANDHNARLERMARERDQDLARIVHRRADADRQRAEAADLRRQAEEMEKRADATEREAIDLKQQYDANPPLPTPMDLSEIRTRINGAKTVNAAVSRRAEKAKHQQIATKYEHESEELTARIAELDHQKRDAIAKAHMPIDGLSFGDDVVLFSGQPFDQASDAERLRVSVAIAARSDPSLRVIRVRRGSDLDTNGMRLLKELADQNDMQIWCERVDESGEVGFVIEDGRLKGQVLPEKAADDPPFELSAETPATKKKQTRRWQGPGAPTGSASNDNTR